MCVTCLKVNVNKDTVVLLQLRRAFWLWESREDVLGMTPRSYADLHISLYSQTNETMILFAFWFVGISQSLLRTLNNTSILTALFFLSFIFRSCDVLLRLHQSKGLCWYPFSEGLGVSQSHGHQSTHACCGWMLNKPLTCGVQCKAFLGDTVEQPRKWVGSYVSLSSVSKHCFELRLQYAFGCYVAVCVLSL